MEITIAQNSEEVRMRDLYEAAQKGCFSTLNTLLQQDPLILHRLSSRTTLLDTPLHISALLGHLEFTKVVLAHCPKLALELDSFRSTPLHLASAQGHIDIVKGLLLACGEACLVRDQERKIPLHYAVVRGRRDVVSELIRAKKESLTFHDDKGKNIFHLCVMHNQLEILKDLVALDTPDTNKMLIEGDSDGNNTILHLAFMLKQVETVRYLISVPKMRSEATKLKNEVGHSAADIVERLPQDSKSLEIKAILMQYCGINFGKINVAAAAREEGEEGSGGNSGRNVVQWMRKLIHGGDGEWVQQMRANLSLVPAIVSTITYQAAINPPGGMVQQGINNRNNNNTVTSGLDFKYNIDEGPLGRLPYTDRNHNPNYISPGDAIVAHTDPETYSTFMIYNSIAFVSSLIVAFLLLSGIPLKSKSMMWVLTLGMVATLSFLLNAYFTGIVLITPSYLMSYNYDRLLPIITWIFNGFLILIAAFIAVMRMIEYRKKRNTSG